MCDVRRSNPKSGLRTGLEWLGFTILGAVIGAYSVDLIRGAEEKVTGALWTQPYSYKQSTNPQRPQQTRYFEPNGFFISTREYLKENKSLLVFEPQELQLVRICGQYERTDMSRQLVVEDFFRTFRACFAVTASERSLIVTPNVSEGSGLKHVDGEIYYCNCPEEVSNHKDRPPLDRSKFSR